MRDGGPFPMEREGAFPLRRRTARDRHQVPAGGPDPRPRHPAADEVRAPPYPPPQPGRDGGGDGSRSSRPKEVRPGVRSPVRAASWRCRRSHSRRPSRRCTEGTSWRRSTTTPRSSPPFDQRGEGRGERRSVGGGGGPPPSGVVTGVRASSARKPPRLDLLTFLTREWGRDIFVGTCLPCTGSARRPVMVMKGTMSYFL